jgi:hypothetical protein
MKRVGEYVTKDLPPREQHAPKERIKPFRSGGDPLLTYW